MRRARAFRDGSSRGATGSSIPFSRRAQSLGRLCARQRGMRRHADGLAHGPPSEQRPLNVRRLSQREPHLDRGSMMMMMMVVVDGSGVLSKGRSHQGPGNNASRNNGDFIWWWWWWWSRS